MNDSLVSIIIPAFNYGHFLPDTLRSVLAQSYSLWECIIIDDGSTDNTAEVVSGFSSTDPRFRYCHQENKGMSAARNVGIKQAAGAFIQFLDADDMLEPKKIELQVTFLQQNLDVDMVYCDVRYFPSNQPQKLYAAIDGSDKSKVEKICGGSNELLASLVVDNILVISSPLSRKRLIDSFGFFDESMRTLEDWEYWLRCSEHPLRVHFLDHDDARPLIRFHPNSASRSRMKMLETNVEMRLKLAVSLDDNRLIQLNRIGLANATFALAMENLRHGRIAKGLYLLTANSAVSLKSHAFLTKAHKIISKKGTANGC